MTAEFFGELWNEGTIAGASDECSRKMPHAGIIRAKRIDQRLRFSAIERGATNVAHELVDVRANGEVGCIPVSAPTVRRPVGRERADRRRNAAR